MPPTIWLVGLRPAEAKPLGFWGRLWQRFWPKTLPVGSLNDGTAVRLLELSCNKAQMQQMPRAQQKLLLQKALLWLSRPRQQMQRLGLPLNLQTLLRPAEKPPQLAPAWALAAREFVRQTNAALPGGLAGKQVAVLGVQAPWHRHICSALLQQNARPLLYGPRAVSLAELFYRQQGVAIPVFGARKAIRSSQVILLLQPALPSGCKHSKAIFSFAEPWLEVPGQFVGRFGFGNFPAGQAAALLEQIPLGQEDKGANGS